MQASKSFDLEGRWFRWSRYQIDGHIIVPSEGAHLEEYDPWAKFRDNEGKYRTAKDQPYVSLLELHRHLEEPKDDDEERLILEWCQGNGLLGILPVLSTSINCPETVEDGLPAKTHHFRQGAQWQTATGMILPDGSPSRDSYLRRYESLPKGSSVTWLDTNSWATRQEDFGHLGPFFRKAMKSIQYTPPCPNTPNFWPVYTEPNWEFKRMVREFAGAVNEVSSFQPESLPFNPRPKHNSVLLDAFGPWRAHRHLNGIAQNVGTRYTFNTLRNTVDEGRVSAGLLASYAQMFLWDFIAGRRAVQCENCCSYFVSDEKRARYCDVACRNTASSRRYRAQKASDK